MAEAAEARTAHLVAAESPVKRFFRATEIDTRLLGMVGALILIWIGFQIFGQMLTGEGVFLTPRNLWNLLVQTSAIAVMSTGMVLIIVMRHIDLSVGSMLSFIGVVTGGRAGLLACALARLRSSRHLDHRRRHRAGRWRAARRLQWLPGRLCRHPLVHRHPRRPHRLQRRGLVGDPRRDGRADGFAVRTHRRKRRAPPGLADGASWALGGLICLAIVGGIFVNRSARAKFKFPQRPLWAEAFLIVIGCAVALGTVAVVNAYPWPSRIAEAYAKDHNIPVPPQGAGLWAWLFLSHAHRPRRRRHHDLPGHAHPLRPLCLRHRRQSGGGRTRRRQHAGHHRADVHDDGHSGRRFGLHHRRPGSTRRRTRSASSTSST